ncbi:MAG TPA: ATP-dependent zinc metalloprotease FtsH [Microthrixaceae bacterium]|nr:ATP-dependent zinc metalloprotease FtsH [Microthrixaceae bacterium]
MKKLLSNVWFWVAVGFLIGAGIFVALARGDDTQELRLDEFRAALADGRVETATIYNKSNLVEGELTSGEEYETGFATEYGDELTAELLEQGIELETDNEQDGALTGLLFDLLPTVLIVGVFLWFVLQMQGGGRANRFGRAKARKPGKGAGVTFADVAGADEAVEELEEIKEFLRDPDRFRRLGARIPKGVLLYGPPGTGKTLLARAVAGEADVPFLTISGSDFVEMFVGVGAARVRDLFKQAKDMAPAIVFVDEIDAVGRHRGAAAGGGHDEREQTLNQMLVEMDGFDTNSNVILMAATNRPDILDPALLRPGRFDRQIAVDPPDRRGREAILQVHAKGKPLTDDVSLSVVARRTPGFTGADLANIVNEAALLAGRKSSRVITMTEVSEAIDRVMAGPERRSVVMNDKEKTVTAFHEAGHALVGHVLPSSDPIHKVSIVARGRALGWTQTLPVEDRYTLTRHELIDRLAVYMGGLSAEELVFDERTTGAADDIERATKIARAMVTEYGMSSELGPQRLVVDDDLTRPRDNPAIPFSDEVATKIDAEVKRLLDHAHATAREVITEHRAVLDLLAARLVEEETLDEEALQDVFSSVGR